MKGAKFALIYHLNLGHSELSSANRKQFLEQDVETLFRLRGRIPVNVSSTGMNWEVINNASPETIKTIRENPNITILDGLFSHMLPTLHPELAELAQKHSRESTDKIFGQTAPVGFAPEHDISSMCAYLLNWKVGVINRDLHSYYPWDEQHNRLIATKDKLHETIPNCAIRVLHKYGSLPCIVAEGGNLRTTYLKLMREQAEPKDFINAVKEALLTAEKAGEPLVSFVMDWETPYINAINGQPRLDLADQLSQALAESDIPFTNLDGNTTEEITDYAQRKPAISHRKNYTKWEQYDFRKKVKDLTRQFSDKTEYEQKTLLAIAESDHDSAIHGTIIGQKNKEKGYEAIAQLPSTVKGTPGIVTIASDAHRAQEYEIMAANLAEGLPLNAHTENLPEASRWYLDQLHKAFK